MTREEINRLINVDFDWLQPDEKVKMYELIRKVYNDAIDLSAGCVNDMNFDHSMKYLVNNGDKKQRHIKLSNEIKSSVMALKLK